MSPYYLETLKKALDDPNMTKEKLKFLVDESQFFFGILRVKVESKDPELREQAIQEIAELKALLQDRLAKTSL